jgi:hypothetical protein
LSGRPVLPVNHFSPEKLPRGGRRAAPPSKRRKHGDADEVEVEVEPVHDEVALMLKALLEKQSLLMEMMMAQHTQGKTEVAPAVKRKVNSTYESAKHDETVPAKKGRHKMKSFIETNFDIARLLEENANFRRHKIIEDLLDSNEMEEIGE